MKKIYFLLLVLATIFVACKKDRDVEFSTFTVEDEKIVASYTSMDLSCKVRCAATINEFYLQYDTVADFSTYQEVALTENEKTEVYSVKIGDLLDNTIYYVRYVAVNSYSQVTSEEVSEFKTLQATTPTIEVREITDVLDTIAIVGFVLKFNGGADVSKIGVCWSVDSVPTIDSTYVIYSIDAAKGVADGDSLVMNISGLKANTTYFVRAYAENKMGIGYSESKSFITLTLPEVKTGEITDIQLTSAVLNGEAIFNGNDTTTEYGFCWGEEADLTIEKSQNMKVEVAEDSTFTYRLSNLQDETKYYVRAYAKNKIGLVYGEVKEFTTQSTVVPTIETSVVTQITYTTATVGGNVISNGGADVIERGVCYSTSSNPTISNNVLKSGEGLGSFNIELKNLQDGTKYYVRAYAKNKKGVSYGEIVEFETLSRFVDLGLSVNWAMCNVGANRPEDYGDYFAWGEVEPKMVYDWSTYKYCVNDGGNLTKYCIHSEYGNNNFIDNKVVLDLVDDVASVNWGDCRMPTYPEIEELKNECEWTLITKKGVNGYQVLGPNGNSIFLPMAGYMSEGQLCYDGSHGGYWSNCLGEDSKRVGYLTFGSTTTAWGNWRAGGRSVRPVQEKQSGDKRYAISVYATPSSLEDKKLVLGTGMYEEGTQVKIIAEYSFGNFVFDKWSDGSRDRQRVITVDRDAVYVAEYKRGFPVNGHFYVDLGLSVKWATCNVGAELPEEGGDYFAWGETIVKDSYVAENYKFFDGTELIKYFRKDYKIILDLEDDAAHVNWGGEWRMPTKEEMQELVDNCTWTFIKGSDGYGVAGYKVTSNIEGYKNNSIFLPQGGSSRGNGSGCYWLASCDMYSSFKLYFSGPENYRIEGDIGIQYGNTIRPVLGEYSYPPNIRKYKILVSSTDDAYGYASGAGIYVEGEEVELSARAEEGYEFVRWNDGNTENPRKIVVTQNATYIAIFEKAKTYQDGHEYVDLGLPSGLKWATCNVGATTPEEYGDYFAWAEVKPQKSMRDWSTYKYSIDYISYKKITKYCDKSNYGNNGFVDNKTILDPEDDAATVNWGSAWRMPSAVEQQELIDNCIWTWTTQNGVNGYKVTGPNGNSIFLPAAGYMEYSGPSAVGSFGGYWSSSLSPNAPDGAYDMYFESDYVKLFSDRYRYHIRSVRPVCH